MTQTVTLEQGGMLPYTLTHDAAGNVVAAGAVVLFRSSDESVFTVCNDEGDSCVAILTGVATGPAVLSAYNSDSNDILLSLDVMVVPAKVLMPGEDGHGLPPETESETLTGDDVGNVADVLGDGTPSSGEPETKAD